MIQEQQFHTGRVAINYAEVPGTGPPLVLLHGGSANWQTFASIRFCCACVGKWNQAGMTA
jgi:pimeloyl-ACP methyl ester carboxylesterase